MAKAFRFKLGTKGKDIVTGFVGTITGSCRYITGCDQYLLTHSVDKEGKLVDATWFDENRIEIIDDHPVKLNVSDTDHRDNGPDLPAPIK